jgi:FHS family L-fucose permease-like MFS transporter
MESKSPRLVSKEYIVPFVLITSLFFLWGFAHAILNVLNKHFQEVFEMTKAHSALIQATMYTGYFTMAIPAGLFITKYGYRKGVVLGLILYGIGAFLFVPSENFMSFPYFLFSLFVIGCGLTFLETAANPYSAELGDKRTAAARLNLSQSFNGLGCICAPVIGGLLLFGDSGESRIALPYVVMGVVVLMVAIVFTKVKLPEIPHEDTMEGIEAVDKGFKGLFRHKVFLFGVLALFCYEVAEISINSFFINYVTDGGWMSKQDAAVLLSFGGLGLFMIGRMLGSLIMSHVPAERVLFVCALCTVVATLLITLNLGVVSRVSLFCCYIFEAIMFPTIFALSLRNLGIYTKRASSLLMMTPIGGAIGPLLMGYVGDLTNMSIAFVVPFVGYAVVALYSYYILNIGDSSLKRS